MSTKKQAATAYHQLGQVLRDLEIDLRWGLEDSPRIPREWHQIAQERIQPARQKISLRVDADVVRFFRAMGEGHLARMNAVLRAFMLSRLAGVVQGEMSYDITPEAREQHKRQDLMERFKAAQERGEA